MRLVRIALAAALTTAGLTTGALPVAASAQTVASPADLRHYAVTIRRFDPSQGPASGQVFVLPVDSPDEEHAIASTLANAAAFSRKAQDGRPLPVAFMAVQVERR